jgi:hypothetical protein
LTLIVVGLLIVMLWVQWLRGAFSTPSLLGVDLPPVISSLLASPTTRTLYLLPVPEGSRLVDQRNIEEMEAGKIQASFAGDALESYRLQATRHEIAAFFQYQLGRHGWEQASPDVDSGEELTLSYCMHRHSWCVEISIECGEPDGLAEFQVRGRKK